MPGGIRMERLDLDFVATVTTFGFYHAARFCGIPSRLEYRISENVKFPSLHLSQREVQYIQVRCNFNKSFDHL
jgi:hypothetical protein